MVEGLPCSCPSLSSSSLLGVGGVQPTAAVQGGLSPGCACHNQVGWPATAAAAAAAAAAAQVYSD
jgi:hypothetical protein